MSERINLALAVAEHRGRKTASTKDYLLADMFLNTADMQAHDRAIARRTVEDMACKIPDTCDTLMNGESATHWLTEQARLLGS